MNLQMRNVLYNSLFKHRILYFDVRGSWILTFIITTLNLMTKKRPYKFTYLLIYLFIQASKIVFYIF